MELFRGKGTATRVLHVALRMPAGQSLVVDGTDVVAQVHEVLGRMAGFAGRVRSREWKGYTGKPVRNVVNVRIGDSDLGPVMAYQLGNLCRSCFMWLELQGRLSARDCERPVFTEVNHWLLRIPPR
jgi:glucose-6-phosphate isomerase